MQVMNECVAPLVRHIPWTHHLIILSQSKRPEEREFYLRLATQESFHLNRETNFCNN